MKHIETIPKGARIEKLAEKSKFNRRQFKTDLSYLITTLVISTIPATILFLAFTGPQSDWDFLEFFGYHSLLYLCVTLSAIALYTYSGNTIPRMNLVMLAHIFIVTIGIVIYTFKLADVGIPLFDATDYRQFIRNFLFVSIGLNISTLVLSNKKGGQ
jgi:uncharacterized membrane protein